MEAKLLHWYCNGEEYYRKIHGSIWLIDTCYRFKIRRSGVQFPALVMYGSVGQTSHFVLPLPTQQ